MFAKMRAQQRHHRLMAAAQTLVREAELSPARHPQQVTYEEIAALAFARYQIRLNEAEAADYLAGALVTRRHDISHLPAVPEPQG